MIDKVIIYRYFYLLLDIQPLHIDLIKEARNFLSSGLHFVFRFYLIMMILIQN